MLLLLDLGDYEAVLRSSYTPPSDIISMIYCDYAESLDIDGKDSEAHNMYLKAIEHSVNYIAKTPVLHDSHVARCESGLIRTLFKLGDIGRGMQMLSISGKANKNEKLVLECVAILEGLKQFNDAAVLLEGVGSWERAVSIWLNMKNWKRVDKFLEKQLSCKLLMQIGRAREEQGEYHLAAQMYERAKDMDAVARVVIDHLGDIDAAAILVREIRSREPAKKLAKLYVISRSFEKAIDFYVIAGMHNEAFELAKSQNIVHYFGNLVRKEIPKSFLEDISLYFKKKGEVRDSAEYLMYAGDYTQALQLIMSAPVIDAASIDLALAIIGEAKDRKLTNQLIDFLMGETDGNPKEAKYIFKLYISLKKYREAAETAIIIAKEEQSQGNYKDAHDLLLSNYVQLRLMNAAIPAELDSMLMILHSYMLIKVYCY